MGKLFGIFGGNGHRITDKFERPVCGGTTDRTDRKAPKVIFSKEIAELSVSFYLDHRSSSNGEHQFCFTIKPDDNGALTVSELRSGESCECTGDLLSSLQAIVDKFDLVLNNGVYRVTAGLPPEFQPSTVRIRYASGEELNFTQNNDPTAEWAEEMYGVFSEWFAQKGKPALLMPRESSQITRFKLVYCSELIQTRYSETNVEEGQAVEGQTFLLQRQIYDFSTRSLQYQKFIPFPEDYYGIVTGILDRYDTAMKYDISRYDRDNRDYGNHSRGYFGFGEKPGGEQDCSELELSILIHAEYESGKKLNINSKKPSEVSAMMPLINELLQYHDKLFE